MLLSYYSRGIRGISGAAIGVFIIHAQLARTRLAFGFLLFSGFTNIAVPIGEQSPRFRLPHPTPQAYSMGFFIFFPASSPL